MSCRKNPSPTRVSNIAPWRAKIVVVGDTDSGKSQLCNILHAGYIPQSISTNSIIFGAANYFLDLESSDGWRDAIEFWTYKNQMRSWRCGRSSVRNSLRYTHRFHESRRPRETRVSSSTPCMEKNSRPERFRRKYKDVGFPSSVTLWDTCGEERFRPLMGVYYSNVDLVLAVYREKNGAEARESALGRARDVIVECANDRSNTAGTPMIVLICITDSPENKTAVSDRFHRSKNEDAKSGEPFQWRAAGETQYIQVDHFVHINLTADSSIQIREKCILRPLTQISFVDDSLHTVDLGSPRSSPDSELDESSELSPSNQRRRTSCLDTFIQSIKWLYGTIQKCFSRKRTCKKSHRVSCSWVP